jgi:hypothetical protein
MMVILPLESAGRNRNLDLMRIFVIDPLWRHLAFATRHWRCSFLPTQVADGPAAYIDRPPDGSEVGSGG